MENEFKISSPSEYPGILIVEGKDDAVFISHIYPHFQREGYGIHSLDGIDNAKAYIQNILRLHLEADDNKLRKIALLLDADVDFSGRCGNIKRWLKMPRMTPGVFVELNNGIVAGFFCLPDNNHEGGLETLAFHACTHEPWSGLCADYIDKAEHAHKHEHKNSFKLYYKRIMQAYLASQQLEPPKTPYLCNGVGYAIKHGLLKIQDEAHFAGIERFLNDFISQ